MHALIKVLFECEHCGKCCSLDRCISQADIDKVEKNTGEPRRVIEEKLEIRPCGYLVNNICSIHFFKPEVCRWWPGPGANCPAYKKLVDKYCSEGMMHRICSEPELTELYTNCLLNNDLQAAQELLRRLNK